MFSDAVSLPFRVGFSRVYTLFAEAGLTDRVTFIGSGKLGLPDNALVAMALGCDLVNVGREAMLAIGCIQAQKCHTDHCPTGVATQRPWLVHGLDAALKAERCANYIKTLRRDLLRLSEAVGVEHPGLIDIDDIDILNGDESASTLREKFDYRPGWGGLNDVQRAEIVAIMAKIAQPDTVSAGS